jgi:hypothetical protein
VTSTVPRRRSPGSSSGAGPDAVVLIDDAQQLDEDGLARLELTAPRQSTALYLTPPSSPPPATAAAQPTS